MIFLPVTESVREKSGGENNQTNETQNLESCVHSALSGTGLPRVNGATKGRAETCRKLYRRPYHDRLDAARKQAGNCSRCGKPNGNGKSRCDGCCDYQKRYREARAVIPITVDARRLDVLTSRVASLELAIARLQLSERQAYKRGYRTGAAHERKVRYAELSTLTMQEAAQFNHAYDRQ